MSDTTITPTNRPESGASPPAGSRRQGRPTRGRSASGKRSSRKRRSRFYTPEERRQAVEAYFHSQLSQAEFARVWGVSHSSLCTWLKRYEEGGPKALERRVHAGKGKRRIGKDVQKEIVDARSSLPFAGLQRIKDWLYRFRGVKVSTGSIRKTLVDTNQPPRQVEPKRRKRRRPDIRRFERAKPGALWQSDITSYVLPGSGLRTYLTVFLDDHSRFIVSWALALHQRQELVVEALLTGIERFGKPEEVLTDQGRQYYAWRGRSGFQKLLIKQGIHHVVARSHHPQTLGKCERLWKTLGEEFWSRTTPRSLTEARERLGHFFTHFNHYRPHQGIDGLVPADRFFQAASDVRRALEDEHGARSIELALGEEPRKRVYLVGRVGDREVSLHGERGRLVINTGDGGLEELQTDQLGMPQEVRDERGADDEEEPSGPAQARGGICDAETVGAGADPRPVAGGQRGGEGEGSRDRGGDPGAVAGPVEPQGDRGTAGHPTAEDLAAVAAGTGGPDRRASEAAAEREGAGGGLGGCASGPCAEEASEAGGGAGEPAAAGGSTAGDAGAAAGQDHEGGRRRWTEEADCEAGYLQSCDEASAKCSTLDTQPGPSE